MLKTKVIELLVSNLTEEELDRLDIVIRPSVEEINKYYILCSAGDKGYMWISTGNTAPDDFILPDPNEEYERRMRR